MIWKTLTPEWALALLGQERYEALSAAKAALAKEVQACRAQLAQNPLAPMVAKAALGERATKQMALDLAVTGDLVLREGTVASDSKKSPLPSIQELRNLLVQKGIDPAPYGRNKTLILKVLYPEQPFHPRKAEVPVTVKTSPVPAPPPVEQVAPPLPPVAPRVKTAPALTVPVVVQPEDLVPLTSLSPEPPQAKRKGRMASLLATSEQVDIEQVLAAPNPSQIADLDVDQILDP